MKKKSKPNDRKKKNRWYKQLKKQTNIKSKYKKNCKKKIERKRKEKKMWINIRKIENLMGRTNEKRYQ